MYEKKLPCLITTQELIKIQNHMKESNLYEALTLGGSLLGDVIKDIYITLFQIVSPQQKSNISDTENIIGNNNKCVANFELGKLVSFYKKAKLQEQWIKTFKKDNRNFFGVNLDAFVANRNAFAHKTHEVSWYQAELSFSILKTFLIATGYVKDFNPRDNYIPEVDMNSVWQIRKPQDLVIITANSARTHTGEYLRPATGMGQVRALALIVNSLTKTYNNINLKNIYLSTDQIYDRLENDLIILGGPKNNQVTQDVLELLQDLQPGYQIDSEIVWKDSSNGDLPESEKIKKYCGEINSETVRNDYALVIKANKVFSNDDNTTLLFSGSHTYGTMAAAKYLIEQYAIDFPAETERGMNFSIVLKCNIRNEYPLNISVEKTFFWPRG